VCRGHRTAGANASSSENEIVTAVEHEHRDMHARGKVECVNLRQLIVVEAASAEDRCPESRFDRNQPRTLRGSHAHTVVRQLARVDVRSSLQLVDGATQIHRTLQRPLSRLSARRRSPLGRTGVRAVALCCGVRTKPLARRMPRAVPPACAANCAVIVSAHDGSGHTGQNCDRGILTGNREFWPVSSEPDGIRFGLANRRLRPLGHLTADGKCT
jgi:hypothetical protein